MTKRVTAYAWRYGDYVIWQSFTSQYQGEDDGLPSIRWYIRHRDRVEWSAGPVQPSMARRTVGGYIGGCLVDHAPEASRIRLGRDINLDGTPELVLLDESGGVCGCSAMIFSLGRRLRLLYSSSGCYCPVFEDVDRDGALEILESDSWRYFCASGAEDPAPSIIHRFEPERTERLNGVSQFRLARYRPAPELMRKPLDDAALERLVTEVEKKLDKTDRSAFQADCPPVALWTAFIPLFYSGNAVAAWKLLDRFWPRSSPGRTTFEKHLREKMMERESWPILKDLNPSLH